MLIFLIKYLSSLYLHVEFGNFLLLLQTGGTAAQNTVHDIHLKQAEQ